MNEEEAIKKLKELQNDDNDDSEKNHVIADDILCDFLNDLGYYGITSEYEKIEKWYA